MGQLPKRAVHRFNTWVLGLRSSPRWGAVVRRRLTVVTYAGRRSGRTFSTPVAYKRSGDVVVIGVQLPDAKVWWRNFEGAGGPLSLELDGVARHGHAVARRNGRRSATVTVQLHA